MDLEITEKQGNDGITILELEGDLDTYNCGELRMSIVEAVESNKRNLVIDLLKVEYIDSTGLGSIVGGYKRIIEHGGLMCLARMNDHVLGVIRKCCLDKVIPNTDRIPQSLEEIRQIPHG